MKWKSAAARRLREMAGVDRIDQAVPAVVDKLLTGIPCPPTDLPTLCTRLNVREVVEDDDTPVLGELRRENGAFLIVCSVGQSSVRRRFTIAHELAHVLFENTGPRAPRVGADLERLCDMLAAEILMPRPVFAAALSQATFDTSLVMRLASQFQTSLTATVLRCTEFRRLSVVCIRDGRRTWSRGPARIGDYQLQNLLKQLIDDQPGDRLVAVERAGLARFHRSDWIRTTSDRSGLLLLTPISSESAYAQMPDDRRRVDPGVPGD